MSDINEEYKRKLFLLALYSEKGDTIVDLLALFKIQGTLTDFFEFLKKQMGANCGAIFKEPTSPLSAVITRAAFWEGDGPFKSFLDAFK